MCCLIWTPLNQYRLKVIQSRKPKSTSKYLVDFLLLGTMNKWEHPVGILSQQLKVVVIVALVPFFCSILCCRIFCAFWRWQLCSYCLRCVATTKKVIDGCKLFNSSFILLWLLDIIQLEFQKCIKQRTWKTTDKHSNSFKGFKTISRTRWAKISFNYQTLET